MSWVDYHNRKRALLIAVSVCILLTIMLLMFKSDFATAAFFGYGAIILVPLAIRHVFGKCPACGKPVHFKKGYPNFFGSRCLHCNIEIPPES